MPKTGRPPKIPVGDLVKDLGEDPQVRDRAKALMNQALSEAEKLLTVGDIDTKMKMIGLLMPTLNRSIDAKSKEEAENPEITAMRVAHKTMMDEMRGE